MSSMTTSHEPRPWHREPMVWLVLGLPALVVAAGIATLVIAIRAGGTDAWPAQVQRTAQVQVEDLSADRAAIAMGLAGALRIDPATGAVQVRLDGVPPGTLQVTLDLIHPARAEGDAQLNLVRSGNVFLGRIEGPATGVWMVQVRDPEGAWRVAGRFEPGVAEVALAPALSEAH